MQVGVINMEQPAPSPVERHEGDAAQPLFRDGALRGQPPLILDQAQRIGAQDQQAAEQYAIERQRRDHARRQLLLQRNAIVPGGEQRQARPQAAPPEKA